jgi:hypothetical protein
MNVQGAASALLAILVAAGCSPHILVDYPNGSGTAKTRCGGAYLVADAPKEGRVLLSAYPGSAAASLFCRQEREALPGSTDTGLPFQAGAEAWLISQGKTRCRITSGRVVGVSHAEFFYACPP